MFFSDNIQMTVSPIVYEIPILAMLEQSHIITLIQTHRVPKLSNPSLS